MPDFAALFSPVRVIAPGRFARSLSIALLVMSVGMSADGFRPQTGGADNERINRRQLDFFERKIRPVLVEHCYKCHAADSKELGGELRVDTRDAIRRGGVSGPAIVPGNLNESLLIDALDFNGLEMPPSGQLPAEVIADFKRWVRMGAPDPRESNASTPAAAPKLTDTAQPELWSLQPLSDVPPPKVQATDWPVGVVDQFVLHRLEAKGLKPVGDARPEVLLRRLSFDLVGLPPTPEDLKRFGTDFSPQSYSAYVDQLLASPQYGERWGRHWLDVVRYAESAGGSRDVLMPHAWRYRDYVIDALNQDLPFDRFMTEQIAGDLLPADTSAEATRLQVATGMLAIGQKSLNGGNIQMDVIDDQIDVVTRAFMGLTAGCARCHDHKFDPIPTRDYYSLAGIFRSTETYFGGDTNRPKNAAEMVDVYLLIGDEAETRTTELQQAGKQIKKLGDDRKKLLSSVKGATKKLPKDWKEQVESLAAVEASELTENQQKLLKQVEKVSQWQSEMQAIEERMEAIQGLLKQDYDYAVGVREKDNIQDCRLHVRGDPKNLGDPIPRGFLTCVSLSESVEIDASGSGRLELARWIAHPENPLTARVAANRVWQHLFGAGLVPTVDNFGSTGLPPTHPELLDYLARRLKEQGWSMKALIRELVMSRTYRLSSDYDAHAYEVDPANALLWRMSRRRLEAEAIRDAMLFASGELNLSRPQGSLLMQIGEGEVGRNIKTAVLAQPYPYRSVYLPIIRGIVPEMLKLFDFPEPSNIQGQRDASNIPAQSLFLMNSPFVVEQSLGLAKHVLESADSDRERVAVAFERVLSREPSPAEIDRMLAFRETCEVELTSAEPDSQQRMQKAWANVVQVLFASAEFRYID